MQNEPQSRFHNNEPLRSAQPSNFGICSFKYSTTASGPLSTCNPCGIACVLISGTIPLAVSWILAASSGDHIDAQNCANPSVQYSTVQRTTPGTKRNETKHENSSGATHQDIRHMFLHRRLNLFYRCGMHVSATFYSVPQILRHAVQSTAQHNTAQLAAAATAQFSLTLSIRNVDDRVAILEVLRDAPDQSLRTLRRRVDRD